MNERDFDMELLIKEIHSRPILWNRKDKYYANKDLKTKAWLDLCAAFDEKYSTSTSLRQMEICQIVQRKFKSLRDSYQRERNLQKADNKTPGKSIKRKKYVYFDQLYFLSSSATKKKEFTRNSSRNYKINKKEGPLNQRVEEFPKEVAIPNNTPKKVITTELTTNEATNLSTSISSALASPQHGPLPPTFLYSDPKNNEEDTLFLLSLVKEIKKIPEDSRLTAKIDILQTIKRWQTSSESRHNGAPTDRNLNGSLSYEDNSIHDCPICKLTFKAESDQRSHMVDIHIKNGLYMCNECSAQCTTMTEIALHMKLHKQDHQFMSETSNVTNDKDESMYDDSDESAEIDIKLELPASEDL